jgi:outer membrane protein assembly factor BamB
LGATPFLEKIKITNTKKDANKGSTLKQAHKTISLGLILAFFTLTAITATAFSADWNMFRGEARHSGVGTGDISGAPRLLWNYSSMLIAGCGYSPTIANGILYEFFGYSKNSTSLHALNVTTGNKIWNYTFANTCSWSPAVEGGILYTGCYDHYVYALNASEGSLIWSYNMVPTSSNLVLCSSPTITNGVVYIGNGESFADGALLAINASTGSKIWNYTVSSMVLSVPAVKDGVVYAGTYDMMGTENYVLAVNATTGTLLWTFNDPNHAYTSSPAVTNGVVYIGSMRQASAPNKVYAINAQTGELVWSQEILGQANSSPAVANNMVCIGTTNGTVYAFNAITGTQIWSYKTQNSTISSPAVSNGAVCIGSSDGFLYTFDLTTGVNLWKFAADGNIAASPAIVDGKIYFISDNSTGTMSGFNYVYSGCSTVYALDATPLIKPTLTVSCTSTTAYNSFHVTINGTLTVNNTGSSSIPIQIAYSNNGGANWQNLTEVTTDPEGKFTAEWFPSASGNYIIKATFNGNLTHASANTMLNLAVLPYQPESANVVFSVTSNSTITDLAFNSTSKQLTFSVNGAANTTGYTDIRIPKSLISDISTLTILVDNNQVTYTYVQETDSWLIRFSYHHSTHTVTINLETPQNPTPTPTPTNSGSSSNTNQQTSTSKTPNPQKTTAPSQTPTVPEFSTVAILSLLTVVPLIAAVILRKQKNSQ